MLPKEKLILKWFPNQKVLESDGEDAMTKTRRQAQPPNQKAQFDPYNELERLHRDLRVGAPTDSPHIVNKQFPYVQSGGGGYPSFNPPSFTQAYSSSSSTNSPNLLSGGSQLLISNSGNIFEKFLSPLLEMRLIWNIENES